LCDAMLSTVSLVKCAPKEGRMEGGGGDEMTLDEEGGTLEVPLSPPPPFPFPPPATLLCDTYCAHPSPNPDFLFVQTYSCSDSLPPGSSYTCNQQVHCLRNRRRISAVTENDEWMSGTLRNPTQWPASGVPVERRFTDLSCLCRSNGALATPLG